MDHLHRTDDGPGFPDHRRRRDVHQESMRESYLDSQSVAVKDIEDVSHGIRRSSKVKRKLLASETGRRSSKVKRKLLASETGRQGSGDFGGILSP